jgi:hypothetical protein
MSNVTKCIVMIESSGEGYRWTTDTSTSIVYR